MNVGRLIIDEPATGAWNMAVDAAILAGLGADDPPILRLYGWSQPTLSLGYFQALRDRDEHLASSRLELVRRGTGGGAIVHDLELTYSLTMPLPRQAPGAAQQVYRLVHDGIIHWLRTRGVAAKRAGTQARSAPAEPFLCFQRRTSEDLLVSGYKVLGSAQRRGQHGVLQHGSLLLATSAYAPELPGLTELTGKRFAGPRAPDSVGLLTDDMCLETAASIGNALQVHWERSPLKPAEKAAAEQHLARFRSSEWTHKR